MIHTPERQNIILRDNKSARGKVHSHLRKPGSENNESSGVFGDSWFGCLSYL